MSLNTIILLTNTRWVKLFFMTVRNLYQESNILKIYFASLRLCLKLGSQRRRDAKE